MKNKKLNNITSTIIFAIFLVLISLFIENFGIGKYLTILFILVIVSILIISLAVLLTKKKK